MTMHLNYPDQIVKGWDSGEPVKALCGFSRVLVEGQMPEGELCPRCEEAAKEKSSQIPDKPLEPSEIRKEARRVVWDYTFTYLGDWPVAKYKHTNKG